MKKRGTRGGLGGGRKKKTEQQQSRIAGALVGNPQKKTIRNLSTNDKKKKLMGKRGESIPESAIQRGGLRFYVKSNGRPPKLSGTGVTIGSREGGKNKAGKQCRAGQRRRVGSRARKSEHQNPVGRGPEKAGETFTHREGKTILKFSISKKKNEKKRMDKRKIVREKGNSRAGETRDSGKPGRGGNTRGGTVLLHRLTCRGTQKLAAGPLGEAREKKGDRGKGEILRTQKPFGATNDSCEERGEVSQGIKTRCDGPPNASKCSPDGKVGDQASARQNRNQGEKGRPKPDYQDPVLSTKGLK